MFHLTKSHRVVSFDDLYESINTYYMDVAVFKKLRDSLGRDVAHVIATQDGIRKAVKTAKKYGGRGRLRSNRTPKLWSQSDDGDSVTFEDIDAFSKRGRVVAHGNEYSYSPCAGETLSACAVALTGKKRKSRVVACVLGDDRECITVYTDRIFDDTDDALGYAEQMAESEAEVMRADLERGDAEMEVEMLQDEVIECRRECLTLIKSIKPIRTDIANIIVRAVYEKITSLRTRIRETRERIKELCSIYQLDD